MTTQPVNPIPSIPLFHLALVVVDPLDESLPHPERVEELAIPLPFPLTDEFSSYDRVILTALSA